jgi:hypothetical protein
LAFALFFGLAGTLLAGQVANPHSSERIGTVQQVYDGALLPDIQVNTFRNIDRLFLTRTVKRGDHVYPLPATDKPPDTYSSSRMASMSVLAR